MFDQAWTSWFVRNGSFPLAYLLLVLDQEQQRRYQTMEQGFLRSTHKLQLQHLITSSWRSKLESMGFETGAEALEKLLPSSDDVVAARERLTSFQEEYESLQNAKLSSLKTTADNDRGSLDEIFCICSHQGVELFLFSVQSTVCS